MDLRRVAVHEAGHVVMATSAGRTVHEVSIVPHGALAGYTFATSGAQNEAVMRWAIAFRASGEEPPLAPLPDGWDLYEAIFMALGGIAAERIGCGGFYPGPASADLSRAVDLIERGLSATTTAEVVSFVDRGIAIAETRLRGRWDSVEKVAAALEARGTLRGHEVRRLVV